MLWYMTEELRADLFQSAPTGDDGWIGDVIEIEPNLEVLPFQFLGQRFIMYFTTLDREFDGDEEFSRTMAANWTGGFAPAPDHRLVKFMRAEADDTETMYESDHWPLPNPRFVFQLGQILVDAVLTHSEAVPEVSQYLYKPGNHRLARLYKRAWATCSSDSFAPILDLNVEEGGIYGYQRQARA